MRTQNVSHAVMSQRHEPSDSRDFFPTPPWSTRALCEYALQPYGSLEDATVWEPACGDGAMARPLGEYFRAVTASDIHPYGYGEVLDFLGEHPEMEAPDWIITNPPFKHGQRFVERAVPLARKGVALLVRTAFLETAARYLLFQKHPPARIAQFAERVAMVKGRLDRQASTATSYCWIIWEHGRSRGTEFLWIPPCRSRLDRLSDWPEENP